MHLCLDSSRCQTKSDACAEKDKGMFSEHVCVEREKRTSASISVSSILGSFGSDFLPSCHSLSSSVKRRNLPAVRVGLAEKSLASLRSKHCSPMMGCNGYQQDIAWALKSDNLCSNPGSVTYQLLKEISDPFDHN